MRIESVDTFWVRIYISGPLAVAEQLLRQECLREGLCVTIDPTKFIYTGGEESGYVVGLVNYPRFLTTPDLLWARARSLAELLLAGTFQQSVLLVSPARSLWLSVRPESQK